MITLLCKMILLGIMTLLFLVSCEPITPRHSAPITSLVSFATGDGHTVAIRTDLTLCAWGNNSSGQLGDGTTNNRLSPVQIQ